LATVCFVSSLCECWVLADDGVDSTFSPINSLIVTMSVAVLVCQGRILLAKTEKNPSIRGKSTEERNVNQRSSFGSSFADFVEEDIDIDAERMDSVNLDSFEEPSEDLFGPSCLPRATPATPSPIGRQSNEIRKCVSAVDFSGFQGQAVPRFSSWVDTDDPAIADYHFSRATTAPRLRCASFNLDANSHAGSSSLNRCRALVGSC